MPSYLLSLILAGVHAETPAEDYHVDFALHPRLLLTSADLETLRHRIETETWAADVYAGIRRSADAWLKRTPQLPDQGGQWWHWYSCKKDGATLQTKSDTEHACPVCGTVYTGYPYDDVILDRKHNALADAIWDCGLVFQISGDARYALKAKQILLAYADRYLSYPLHNIHGEPKVGGGRVGPQTLDESTWLIKVAQGADLIWDTLSESEQRRASDDLFRPAAMDVIQKHRMGIHNIQCWKNSAVSLVGFLLGDPALVWDAIESKHGYRQQMAHGVRPGGPWFEGAWGYHFYTLSALWSLTEAAYQNGIDLYGPPLKSMFDAPLDFAMPNLHLPAFNDSSEVNIMGYGHLYEIAYARYDDPKYLQVLKRRTSKQALLVGVPVEKQVETPAQQSRNYSKAGYAILTQGTGLDATWLCVDYGPHGGGHGHPDKLSFVLYTQGQVVLPDPGTARYGVPIQREWYRQTLAHNTLTVDERSQKPTEGHCLAFDPDLNAALFEAGGIYDRVTYYRTVALIDENLLLLVDRAVAEETHTFDFAYHQVGQWVSTPEGVPWQAPDKPGYMHLRDTQSSALLTSAEFTSAVKADWPVVISVCSAESMDLIWGTGVGRNTADRVPFVIARLRSDMATVAWLVGLDGTHHELELLPLDVGSEVTAVRVRQGDESSVWISNPTGAHFECGGETILTPLTRIPEK